MMNVPAMDLNLDRLLSIISFVSIAVILVILAAVAIGVLVPPSGTVGSYMNYSKIAKALVFLYGTMFAPGVIVSAVYAVYAWSRSRGRSKSCALEIISVIVAVQTVFTFTLLQDV